MKFSDDPLKQYPPADLPYDDFYSMWELDLKRIASAYSYRFRERGWSHDNVECLSSLRLVFWQSYINWKPGGRSFGIYFWSSWNNYMTTVARRINTSTRDYDVDLAGDKALECGVVVPDYLFLPPSLTERERQVAELLSCGYEPHQVRSMCGLTPRQYRSAIQGCRRKISKE